MGAGIAASPHCAERRICRCSSLNPPEGFSVLDPGSPAQASLLTKPLSPRRSPTFLLQCAAREPASVSARPAGPKAKPFDCPRPFLGRPLLAFRFAPAISEETAGAASREREIISSGASSRLAPDRHPKASFHCLPAEIGTLEPAARGRLAPPSRSPDDNAPVSESRKAKNRCSSLWITGISGTTVGTFSWLPESAPHPTSAKCLNFPR
jgi:hypothetical protein